MTMPPPDQQPTGYPPQPPPGYPPAGYPPYYAPMQPGMPGPLFLEPPTAPTAIASLICSIAGFVGFPLLGSVAGVILGHIALGQINRQPPQYAGRGLAMAGLIIGYAGLAIFALIIAFIILFVAVRVPASGQ